MTISERLRNLSTQPAPVELRQRILASLYAERRLSTRPHRPAPSAIWPSDGQTRWLLAVAWLAVLVVVMLHPITPPPSALPASDSIFATALVALPITESLSSSDGDEVGEWLQVRIGYSVELPDITGASLLGGRIAVIGGASAAAVAYTMHGQPLTFVVLPEASGMSESIAEDDVRTESANGYNVAIWRELGLVRAVVSPMSSQMVSSVAYQCKRKAPAQSP